MDLVSVFIIGLTAGGLTCLVTQAGLLASALSRQVAVPATPSSQARSRRKASRPNTVMGLQMATNHWPVVYFLAAKVVGYTLLGLLLGLLGSAVQLTPTAQGVMQIAAGLYMLATALNMLNVHPIFRYVVIQPPKALTRLVRNQAKSQEVFAPAILGFMTIFIPCGTTQAMEVLAISSGSPLAGAATMFVYTLGTAPTFFVLGFLATRIRGRLQSAFAAVTVALILILGIFSLDNGLNLLDSPFAPSRVLVGLMNPGSSNVAVSGTPVQGKVTNGVQELTINVTSDSWNGYSPNYFSARSGQPIRLKLVTNNTFGCPRAFTIPSLRIQKILPATGETIIDLPALPVGNLAFRCSMGMSTGLIKIS